MTKKIPVSALLNKFDFKVINKGQPNSKFISSSGVARIGIELATKIKPVYKRITSVVCFGTAELNFFKQLTKRNFKKTMERIKKLYPPMIILNSAFKSEDIKNLMRAIGKTNIPIASLNMSSTNIYIELSPWIARELAPVTTVHGTLMSIFGIGALITGNSGSGKSEAAMELIKTGHLFVGDDAIEVYNYGQSIYGHSSDVAKHFIEVRGLGILNVARMFGRQITLRESSIDMIVDLVPTNDKTQKLNTFERLGTEQPKVIIRGVSIPKYSIPVATGRPTASLIESAVIDFKLKSGGYNSANEYLVNYESVINKSQKRK